MKMVMIGDVVGEPGRDILYKFLEKRKNDYDFIIVNGENAASGFGITPKIAKSFLDKGVTVITLGNHTYDRKEIYSYLDEEKRIIRPLNYHEANSGHGYVVVNKNGVRVAVINLQGKVFMQPIACPFLAIDDFIPKIKDKVDIIIVDFHAEATSEKQAMGWNLAGNVSVIYGTHTHTQTSDDRILYGKTGFITDIGMTGGFDGVLGMNKRESLKRLKEGFSSRYVPCEENLRIHGIECIVNEKTGFCESIKRLDLGYDEI
ncbi:TIGR00282 family metallophosphoesterase [Oceanivirga miroungae]|uniref:Metallophosphoesterase n=1 Tax=Oceanivirga miroungae TaxID=1130046 RepID=A0A6I8MDB9_9FUSO|nr:TIGR00282 family metallophosphoesterase [Oceanivirga miroungae]VWL85153.1 metallophosphoesterase [Oceanivirga miroungae]